MHTKLMRLLIVTICLLAFGRFARGATTNDSIGSVSWELPIHKTLAGVKMWAHETLSRPEFVEVANPSTNMLIILARAESGRPSTSIVFMYSLESEDNSWRPRLLWNSYEEQLRVEKTRRGGLLFKSKAGKTLMTLPSR